MRTLKNSLKILALLIAIILVALPYVAKFAAINYLETEKNIDASIGDLRFNLFSGKVGLQDVHLYGAPLVKNNNTSRNSSPNTSRNSSPNIRAELHLGLLLIDLSMLDLFSKNILVESIEFQDFKTNVTEVDGGWNIGGISIPLGPENAESLEEEEEKEKEKEEGKEGEATEDSASFNWGYGVRNISISNIQVNVNSQYTDSDLVINNIKVRDLLSWFPGNNSPLEIDLNINGDNFKITGDASPFLSEPTLKTRIAIADVQIKPFLKSVKDLPFDETKVAVFSDLTLELISKSDQTEVSILGTYGLKDILLKDASREINLDELYWDGKQNIVLPKVGSKESAKEGVKKIDLDGALSLKNIDITDNENNAHVLQDGIILTGKYNIALDENTDQPNIAATAELILEKLNINTLDGKSQLVSFDNFSIKNINVKNVDDVTVGKSELNNLILLTDRINKKASPVARLEKLAINNIHYQPNNVEIVKIELNEINAEIILDKKGNIPALNAYSAASKKSTETSPEKAEDNIELKKDQPIKTGESTEQKDKSQFHFVLKEIEINSTGKIHFVDYSVTPVFDTKLHDLKFLISDINSLKPKRPANADISVRIDEYTKFTLKGNAHPFAKKLNAKLLAKLDALELAPLSSYAGKFAGINIKRGTLNINADIDIKHDILDVKNTFYLNQLNIESDNSEVSDNLFKDMPMPLDITLDVLRDKNNVIKLDIPVKGDINNPDFSLQDIYNTAMVKAMKFAATHYLMQAVQPLGLIMTASKLAGKAMAPKFDPLLFDPGSSAISKTNQEHIKKLARILQDKDKLRFTICGNATESDWKVIQANLKSKSNTTAKSDIQANRSTAKRDDKALSTREQILLKMANDRTKQVKNHFVKVHNIAAKRLFACNGKITKDENDKPAIPMVEITL